MEQGVEEGDWQKTISPLGLKLKWEVTLFKLCNLRTIKKEFLGISNLLNRLMALLFCCPVPLPEKLKLNF